MIDIRDISGSIRFSTLPDGKRKFLLMKEDYITVKFNLEEPVFFKLGDYVDCDFGLFEICDIQKPTYNTSTAGYDYELRLDAHYWKWKNKIFKYTPETAGQEASWNLTAPLDVQAGIVLRNLKALGYTYKGQDFVFSIDSTVENKSQLMSYDNINILDACFEMAKKWDCECWVTENIIHFGRCENGTAVDMEIGVNVDEMSRSDSQSTYATRIYAFGSTRNIPANYRPVDEAVVVNGVVQKRLMLPEGTPYVDAYPDMSNEEAVEQVIVLDEVYPRRTSTMSGISAHEYTDNNEDTGEVTKWNAYRFKDAGITFSKDYVLPGEELKITFQSGKLNGMVFGVTFDPDNKNEQLWEIIRNEDYGRPLPDGVLVPADGDAYVLSGWDSTKITKLGLVAAAEQELKTETEKYVAKSKIDPSTYNVKMMSDAAYSEDGVHNLYGIGQRVNLINKAYFEDGSRQSRIIGFEYNLDIPYDSPIYTVGETASYSRIGEIEDKVDSITLKGQTYVGSAGGSGVYLITSNDTTPATDSNTYSAKRIRKSFLSKEGNDSTPFSLTIGDGTKSPSFTADRFVEGWLGEGGRLWYNKETGKSKLEVDEVVARDSFETTTLRFNQVDVISGETWNTFAYGTIKEVDEKRKIVHLDLVEGEYMTAHVNDLMRGVFHDVRTENNEKDTDDECGFPRKPGFSTSYFTPVSLLPDGSGFRYALRSGTNVHPKPGMKFAAYGNFTDKARQSSAYSTRTRLILLDHVNTWVIDPSKHYYYVRGKLDMEYGGMEFKGSGTIQRNSYIYGSQIFFSPEQMDELKGNASYSVNLSDYEGIVNVDLDGNIVGGITETYNVVTGDRNVVTQDMNVVTTGHVLTARIQAFKGEKELFHSDEMGTGAFITTLYPTGCTAEVQNGILTILSVTNPDNCFVDIEVNCEGNAVFTKTYKVTAVKNGYSPLFVDLDNEMDSVACDSEGNVLFGLPLRTNVSVFYGTKKLAVKEIVCTSESGVTVDGYANGQVIVSYIPKSAPDTFAVTVSVKADYDGKEFSGTAVFTINKVKTSAIYNLLPSVSAVKVDANDEYSEAYVSCKVRKNDGTTSAVLSSIPTGYSMQYSLDGGSTVSYSYGASVNVSSSVKNVQFYLYYGSSLVDVETIPVIIDGKNGGTSFKSTVFIRTNSTPSTPSGGSFISPVPTTAGWSDGIPDGSARLWASTRIFSFDGKAPQQNVWSTPAQMTDTANFDVEFSSVASPNPPVGHPNTNTQWSNTSDSTTIWMATSTCTNGVWSAWSVSKIKGEKGDAGTGIQIKGSKPNVESLPQTGNTVGDAYTVKGVLYVWDGDSWEDAGNIKGEPGEPGAKSYLHIKYSNDGGKTFTANGGETPGKYIGLLADYNEGDSANPTAYQWAEFRGDDGFYNEYIYKRTTNETAPDTPTTSTNTDDYAPTGWTDDPTGVSTSYPYEWMAYRTKENGVWSAYKGSSANNAKAALWAKYGADGNGIKSVAIYYLATDKSTGVTTSTSGWSTAYQAMTATNRYLWKYTLTTYTNGTTKVDGPLIIGVYGDRGLNGCIMRMFENGITVGQVYRNDVENTSGVYRYLDHIAVEKESYDSGYAVYQCVSTHTATSVTEYTNTSLWVEVTQNVGSAFFSYLLAKNANIKLLSGAQFVVQDNEGKTVGGMQGNTDLPIIWAGADEVGIQDAPFMVMQDGTVNANKLKAKGSLLSGDDNGQRVEIDPGLKKISVYNADGEECTRLEGNRLTRSEIMPQDDKAFTLVAATGSLSGSVAPGYTYVSDRDISSRTASLAVSSTGLASVVVMSSVSISFIGVAPSVGDGYNILLYMDVDTYSDASYTTKTSSKSLLVLQHATSARPFPTNPNFNVTVEPGYHLLRARLVYSGTEGTKSLPFSVTWNISSAVLSYTTYISRFFSNGFSVSKNKGNYLHAIVESYNYLSVFLSSAGRLFSIENGVPYTDGVKQPVTVYAAKVQDSSASSSVAPTKTDITKLPNTTVSISKLGTKGHYRLTFPSEYKLSTYTTVVQVTGFGKATGETDAVNPAVYSLTSTYIEVACNDVNSSNYGGFFIEVKNYY